MMGEGGYVSLSESEKMNTTWKVSVFGIILVLIFPHSDWIRRNTEYLSVFSPNAGKYGPEKLRICSRSEHLKQIHIRVKTFYKISIKNGLNKEKYPGKQFDIMWTVNYHFVTIQLYKKIYSQRENFIITIIVLSILLLLFSRYILT